MPLLNQARLFMNKLLAPAGFAIQRVRKYNPWGAQIVSAKVGKFSIRVPRTNKVSIVYEEDSDYMGQLAALVSVLKKKYSNLSAIDVGANVGDTVCIIKTAADIPIMCIEGDETTFAFLEQNLRQFQSVTAHKIFLGDKTGTVMATLENVGWNTTIKPNSADGAQMISIVTLDDFLLAHPPLPGCKLLKVDAEGFDCSIIRGAKKILQQTHPAITFEYNRDNMDAISERGIDVIYLLRDLGYSHMAFHDCNGRFFADAKFSNMDLIRDFLDYSDGKTSEVYYFDLTIFHEEDGDIAREYIGGERERRPNPCR